MNIIYALTPLNLQDKVLLDLNTEKPLKSPNIPEIKTESNVYQVKINTT